MVIRKKTYGEIVSSAVQYLSENTKITYFGDGSVAKSLIEATALEISRLQDFVVSLTQNSFLSTAYGVYLDLFGEMLGLPRITSGVAVSKISDKAVRFYVSSGTLGTYLGSGTKGTIPAGTVVSNEANTVLFTVSENISFPINSKSVYVPVTAQGTGSLYNVGVNQLTRHSLNYAEIKVTNDSPIATGSDTESDNDYRYRLTRAMTYKAGANRTAVQITASSQPGTSDSRILEFARGAGTYDVLLIPRGNTLTETTKQNTERVLNDISAFGISSKVREPEYVTFKLTIMLRYAPNTAESDKDSARQSAQTSVLSYMGNIPLGGEFITNQLRSAVLNSHESIIDLKILELCVEGRQRTIRNFSLREDELLIPDNEVADPVEIV